MNKIKLLTISGKSCSGKTFLQNQLIKDNPNLFHKVIQFTTREPRINEKNGKDYYFIKNFNNYAKNNQILEMLRFSDQTIYGTNFHELKEDKINILICNPRAVKQIGPISKSGNIDLFSIQIFCNEYERLNRVYTRINKEEDYKNSLLRVIADQADFVEYEEKYEYYRPYIVRDIEELYHLLNFKKFIGQN